MSLCLNHFKETSPVSSCILRKPSLFVALELDGREGFQPVPLPVILSGESSKDWGLQSSSALVLLRIIHTLAIHQAMPQEDKGNTCLSAAEICYNADT